MTTDHHAPHRRLNSLNGKHVLVSPHRALRPWLGQAEELAQTTVPAYDPTCYLCPGNQRANGVTNPDYAGPWLFDNDFPALLAGGSAASDDPLFAREAVTGCCRVLCFSPDHAAGLPDLPPAAMRAVIDCWCDEVAALGREWPAVQLFENKGAMMGCSNPHPHGQIWATSYLPDELAVEDARQRDWAATHGSAMLADVAAREIAEQERIVAINDHWLVVVPWWASWPFETLLLTRGSEARLPDLSDAARDDLGAILQRLTRGYDALFGVSFPYSMGWHGAPFDDRPTEPWRVHAHFYPPLLRSATVRKFMVGFEMLAEAQRDLTPEQAAERLRAVMPA